MRCLRPCGRVGVRQRGDDHPAHPAAVLVRIAHLPVVLTRLAAVHAPLGNDRQPGDRRVEGVVNAGSLDSARPFPVQRVSARACSATRRILTISAAEGMTVPVA